MTDHHLKPNSHHPVMRRPQFKEQKLVVVGDKKMAVFDDTRNNGKPLPAAWTAGRKVLHICVDRERMLNIAHDLVLLKTAMVWQVLQ